MTILNTATYTIIVNKHGGTWSFSWSEYHCFDRRSVCVKQMTSNLRCVKITSLPTPKNPYVIQWRSVFQAVEQFKESKRRREKTRVWGCKNSPFHLIYGVLLQRKHFGLTGWRHEFCVSVKKLSFWVWIWNLTLTNFRYVFHAVFMASEQEVAFT